MKRCHNIIRKGAPKTEETGKFRRKTEISESRNVFEMNPYVTQKGKIKTPNEFRQFLCKCACLERVGLQKAKEEFNKFYSVTSHDAQRAFICVRVRECSVKRKRVKESSKTTYTRQYVVKGVTVCKHF